jgi:hypothetical protein
VRRREGQTCRQDRVCRTRLLAAAGDACAALPSEPLPVEFLRKLDATNANERAREGREGGGREGPVSPSQPSPTLSPYLALL